MIDTTALTSGEGHVVKLVLHDACGRFWPVFRHPLSFRDHILALSLFAKQSVSLGLLVTDQFVKTIYVASTEIRWRRKSKIVHAKRPG